MRPAVSLAFCCACSGIEYAYINDNGQFTVVEGGNIYEVKGQMVLCANDEEGTILLELDLTSDGTPFLEGWSINEILSSNKECALCLKLAQEDEGASWKSLSSAEKTHRRLASASKRLQKGNARDEVKTSAKDEHQIVKLDDYRKKGSRPTPDRPVPRDDKRRHGQAGKATHIKKAARRAGAY